jgi:hypothetical protein
MNRPRGLFRCRSRETHLRNGLPEHRSCILHIFNPERAGGRNGSQRRPLGRLRTPLRREALSRRFDRRQGGAQIIPTFDLGAPRRIEVLVDREEGSPRVIGGELTVACRAGVRV